MCLFKYIRQLKEKNNPVVFEKENINTMESKDENKRLVIVATD